MTPETKVSFPRGSRDPLPAELAPFADPETGALDVPAIDSAFLELEALDRKVAAIAEQVAMLELDRAALKEKAAELEARLIGSASVAGAQLENGHYIVRYTPGRASTSWDAAKLDALLPDALKGLCLTYIPKADGALLGQLEKSGKLPPEAAEAKTVKPAAPRYVLERR